MRQDWHVDTFWTDCLREQWRGQVVWCNPPFSDPHELAIPWPMLVVLARPQKKFFQKEKALRERHAAQPDVTPSGAAANIKDTTGVVEPGGVPASVASGARA
ncbi:hypothetical protein CYMTET_4634 [Cymbomonas tetramitiformis]|uniref:Uncharacterized protein n=1 Tax=Cymbomonas tetramitiformis TaxID=36881 RepID=A0AAE0LK65_9CHLO|nr:hypothetical protein CYMTET_4634 [Cymbomonas tetramitiformis]